METLFKTFAAEVKASSDARQIKFIISTNSVDRDGDTMDPKGWDTAAYMKNPCVLWSHDYSSLPVAKAIKVEQTKNGLAAIAEFPPKGVHPFADTVYELCKGGFLGAASVGFRPIEHTKGVNRDHGFDYVKQELLEWSIVPIPANPEALVQMSASKPQHKGLLKPLVSWSEKFLSEYYGERGVWLPASQVEKTFDLINTNNLLRKDGAALTVEKTVASGAAGEVSSKDGANQELVLELSDDLVLEFSEDVFDIERDQLAAAIADCTAKAVSELVGQEVTRAVRYHTGRVS